MAPQPKPAKEPTRRAFLGWWLGTLMAATVVSAVAPIAVYLFPPRDPKQIKENVRVALDAPLMALREGAASRFDAPAGTAFVIADGGESNSPGDPTFGGELARAGGQRRALAITGPHLRRSYALQDGQKHFLGPWRGAGLRPD